MEDHDVCEIFHIFGVFYTDKIQYGNIRIVGITLFWIYDIFYGFKCHVSTV